MFANVQLVVHAAAGRGTSPPIRCRGNGHKGRARGMKDTGAERLPKGTNTRSPYGPAGVSSNTRPEAMCVQRPEWTERGQGCRNPAPDCVFFRT